MRILLGAVLAILLVSGLSGCIIAREHNGHIDYDVIIPRGHVHSHDCGHYQHHGRWLFLRGHVHGHNCGHHHVNGVWIIR